MTAAKIADLGSTVWQAKRPRRVVPWRRCVTYTVYWSVLHVRPRGAAFGPRWQGGQVLDECYWRLWCRSGALSSR